MFYAVNKKGEVLATGHTREQARASAKIFYPRVKVRVIASKVHPFRTKKNPSLAKTWRIIQISTNAELGKISAPSSGGAIKNYINKVGLPLSDKKYLQAIEVKKNPSLAKTGKWIKAKAVRIVGKTLQILK